MTAAAVVLRLDPGDDREAEFLPRLPAARVEDVLLQEREEALHAGVVARAVGAPHRPDQPVVLEQPLGPLRAKLAASVRMADRADRLPQSDRVAQRRPRQRSLHARVDRVADDLVAADVLDRADVELALTSGVLGDVPEPDLVRGIGGELMPDDAVLVDDREEVIMRGRPGGAGLGTLLVMAGGDSSDAAEPMHAVLADGDAVLVGQFIGEESVAEGRIIAVSLVEDVDEVSIVPVPLGDRGLQPLVVPLGR